MPAQHKHQKPPAPWMIPLPILSCERAVEGQNTMVKINGKIVSTVQQGEDVHAAVNRSLKAIQAEMEELAKKEVCKKYR